MKTFSFVGKIPASKSMMNRALLLQSYQPNIKIDGDSNCDDVRNMKMAIVAFIQKKPIPCGEAGTVLRFMAMRVSREPGLFKLTGSERLLKRPQSDLMFLLNQLTVNCQIMPHEVVIQSKGWQKPLVPMRINRDVSSQFATALLLNSWRLPYELKFEMKSGVSEGYWRMSVEMAQQAGMSVLQEGDFWRIPPNQEPHEVQLRMEPDYSSAFSIAAAGALCGETTITNAGKTSYQPDFRFIQILKQMGVSVEHTDSQLKIKRIGEMKPIDLDLSSSPDLFPVLAVLCSFAKGNSVLRGAPHLIHKESDRIQKTAELLKSAGLFVSMKSDGMAISGQGHESKPVKFLFDPDEDHRMAMAAGLLKLKGFEIQIKHPQVVNKSYPEFWQALGIQP